MILPCLFILLGICILIQFDRKFLPSAMAISHMQAKSLANKMIDESVEKILKEKQVHSADFFIGGNTGGVNSFSANTMLINEICSSVSDSITNALDKIMNEKIDVPFGMLTGIDFLANTGPSISFSIRPMGETEVDYDTSFVSVGINQTNFKVWMNIKITIQVINPLKKEKVMMTRKLMLVDTVINGEVPEWYMESKE